MRCEYLIVLFAMLEALQAFGQVDAVCHFESLLPVQVAISAESEQLAEVQELLRAQGIAYHVTVLGFKTHFEIETCFRQESKPRIVVDYEGGGIPEDPDALRTGIVTHILFDQLKRVRGPVNLKKSWEERLNSIVDRLSSGHFSHWNKEELAQGVSQILQLRTVWNHKIGYYETNVPVEKRPLYIVRLSQSEREKKDHFREEFKKFYQFSDSEMGDLVDAVWSEELPGGWETALSGMLRKRMTLEPNVSATSGP